ncbi:hypothetical protein RND71_027336 [Anisodus tanguticus]|uniref:RNA cytidine acetyltransferase n=1 Tax=Anisodus tanguticus TaxID=243964 RepID=A0AAE1V0F0_9SOLA|nr:hypothetical protein RND71_027336 [Anisodus tanguticus]
MMQQGVLDPEKVDPFELFIETGGVSFCLYRDSERILGNTYGMCVLQDFEALTPDLLARTIETVEGGGLIVLLIRTLPSLKRLYTMAMDVHERFRRGSHSHAIPRFNERFVLSLASCETCIFMNDEWKILPISSHVKNITAVPVQEDSEGLSEAERELRNLKEQLNEDFPVGPLIHKFCTLDQGKAVITFLDAILDKTLRSTVALLAARGRGKSAALGLAIAGADAAGYSNIYVTAPSPENLKTLFDCLQGFHYARVQDFLYFSLVLLCSLKVVSILYILPHEDEKKSQVELLVVDEAAAIPLPIVKSLLGPYLVFLASTVNGYWKILSLKLLQQLEEQSQKSKSADNALSEYKQILVELLGSTYRKMNYKLAMSVFDPKINFVELDPASSALSEFLNLKKFVLEPHEIKRLEAYSNSPIDYPLEMIEFFIMIHGLGWFEENFT